MPVPQGDRISQSVLALPVIFLNTCIQSFGGPRIHQAAPVVSHPQAAQYRDSGPPTGPYFSPVPPFLGAYIKFNVTENTPLAGITAPRGMGTAGMVPMISYEQGEFGGVFYCSQIPSV